MITGPVVKRRSFEDAIPAIENSLQLYRRKVYPEGIEAFMVATPLKRGLRAVYGKSNLGVAWSLLVDAIRDLCYGYYWNFRYRIGWLNDDMRAVSEVLSEDE